MSLLFTLDLEADLTPSMLLLSMAKITGLPFVNSETLKDKDTCLVISAYTEDDKWNIQYILDEYGFKPKVSVHFTHGKVKHEENSRIMMQAVSEIFRDIPGDAVLDFSEGGTVLRRVNNNIIIDPRWENEPGMELVKKSGLRYKIEKHTT